MTISDEDLSYQKHVGWYRNFGHLTGDAKRDAFWYYQAQDMHALHVMDAVRDIQTEIVSLGQTTTGGEAYHHLVYGAARRSRMIWGATRQLYGLIAPNRKEPLPHDDVFEAARALNDIYIHTRGVMDNYAWALFFLFGDQKSQKTRRTDIVLFGNRFLTNERLKGFASLIEPFREWDKNLKELRDPVAHRIPLSVPPAVLTPGDHEVFKKTNDEWSAAQSNYFELIGANASQVNQDAAAADVDALLARMSQIGTFVPVIVHDPTEDGVPIYPTVPEDIGQLVKLVRSLNKKIAGMIAA